MTKRGTGGISATVNCEISGMALEEAVKRQNCHCHFQSPTTMSEFSRSPDRPVQRILPQT